MPSSAATTACTWRVAIVRATAISGVPGGQTIAGALIASPTVACSQDGVSQLPVASKGSGWFIALSLLGWM